MADLLPLEFTELSPERMRAEAELFLERVRSRRTTRDFSTRPVPRVLIERAIQAAATAPSGANLQPWTFVVVSRPEIKRAIREAAEEEERRSYAERMPEAWLEVLAPLGTDADKPHLTDAPHLVVLFKHSARYDARGERQPTYYASESVGIAAGFFICAIHMMGLATLTHTPSPMGFLSRILERPDHEKPYLLMPVGYPREDAMVPRITKKPFEEVAVFVE